MVYKEREFTSEEMWTNLAKDFILTNQNETCCKFVDQMKIRKLQQEENMRQLFERKVISDPKTQHMLGAELCKKLRTYILLVNRQERNEDESKLWLEYSEPSTNGANVTRTGTFKEQQSSLLKQE